MYTILRVYDDFSSCTEQTDSLSAALSACAIYVEIPDLINLKIWETATGDFIFDYGIK